MRFKMTPFVELSATTSAPFMPGKPGDVGHDLHVHMEGTSQTTFDRLVSEIIGEPVVIVWPFSAKLVASGIAVNQPNDVWCWITARSSAARKKLMVLGGVIDSGYQGELFTVLHNFGLTPRIIRNGERYSQVIFYESVRPLTKRVLEFSASSERGSTGFGSTGQ
jgi:dUTP pyrophosphatase